MKISKNTYVLLAGAVIVVSLSVAGTALASATSTKNGAPHSAISQHSGNASSTNPFKGLGVKNDGKPQATGNVISLSGNIVTIQSVTWDKIASSTSTSTYTVDATNAKITRGFGRNSQSTTLVNIAIGDRVVVFGTTTSSTIEATYLVDEGAFASGPGHGINTRSALSQHIASSTLQNENTHFGGTVGSINGNTFNLEIRVGNATSTVATTTFGVVTTATTTFKKAGPSVATLSDVTTGSKVMVAGTLDSKTKIFTATEVDINMFLDKSPHIVFSPRTATTTATTTITSTSTATTTTTTK